MLKTLELHNFKGHRDTKFDFDDSRLHALVGRNSSGKTSILQALYCLFQISNSRFGNTFQYENSPEFIATMGEKNMSVSVSGDREDFYKWQASYEFHISEDGNWQSRRSWQTGGGKSGRVDQKGSDETYEYHRYDDEYINDEGFLTPTDHDECERKERLEHNEYLDNFDYATLLSAVHIKQ